MSPQLITSGVIARKLGEPLHRVVRVLATRDIIPAAYAGQTRLYHDEVIEIVQSELDAITARRPPRCSVGQCRRPARNYVSGDHTSAFCDMHSVGQLEAVEEGNKLNRKED
jgi:hypothetical protein